MSDAMANETPQDGNRAQHDDDAQAQTVSDEAMARRNPSGEPEESRKPASANAAVRPEDAPDLVDHMHQMVSSGRIDMDAYRGERSDDDEPDTLGEAALEPDDVDSHGNRPTTSY